MRTKRCWIVCRDQEDTFYEGSPTGMVFTDEEQAKAYIQGQSDLYLEKGYLNEPETEE